MKLLTNIRNWFDNKLADTIFSRIIDKWQTLHPSSYLGVLAVSAIVHIFSTEALQQHAILCETAELCIKGVEYYLIVAGYFASLVSGFLSGSITFTQLRDKITDRPTRDTED